MGPLIAWCEKGSEGAPVGEGRIEEVGGPPKFVEMESVGGGWVKGGMGGG